MTARVKSSQASDCGLSWLWSTATSQSRPEVYLFLVWDCSIKVYPFSSRSKARQATVRRCIFAIDPLFSGLPVLSLADCLKLAWSCFYIQERVGKNHKTFGCIKFRTMVTNADEILIELMETSPQLRQVRIISNKILKLLKLVNFAVTSLDEFQFWNVLKGDMSVVGPPLL